MVFLEEITTNVLWMKITLAQLKLYTANPVNMIHSGENADLLRDLGRTRCWAESGRERGKKGRKGKEVEKLLLFWHDL